MTATLLSTALLAVALLGLIGLRTCSRRIRIGFDVLLLATLTAPSLWPRCVAVRAPFFRLELADPVDRSHRHLMAGMCAPGRCGAVFRVGTRRQVSSSATVPGPVGRGSIVSASACCSSSPRRWRSRRLFQGLIGPLAVNTKLYTWRKRPHGRPMRRKHRPWSYHSKRATASQFM